MVTWFHRRGWVAMLLLGLTAVATPLVAQSPPAVVLVLDAAVLDHAGVPPEARNAEIATIGLRGPIPYFATRVGASVTLSSGRDGHAGWFALRSVPASWSTERGADDGLKNFLLPGPGLGSPDSEGERASLLETVENVVPLKSPGLGALVGRAVCAVVYRGRIAVDAQSADLTGPTLGVVAFQITEVQTGAVTVTVLNTHNTCSGALASFSDAP